MRENNDDLEPSGLSMPNATEQHKASHSVTGLSNLTRPRAVNPGPGISFYSIADDIATLIPPSVSLKAQKPTPPLSPRPEQDLSQPAVRNILEDPNGNLEMATDFNAAPSPYFGKFLKYGMQECMQDGLLALEYLSEAGPANEE